MSGATERPMETTTTHDDLALLLGDFDRAAFFAHHWEKRSLHLPHADPLRFAHLISHESFFGQEIQRCQHLKASTRAKDGWNQEVRIQPEQAEKLFKAGLTICASILDEDGPCRAVLAAYRSAFVTAAPPHVNCYYSPDQAGYGLHFDTHPVWILQVAGSKHWTVSFEPAVVNPPFNVIFPPGRQRVKLPWITLDRPDVDDPERFMHVRLDPGDVLYIPAGGWHAARAEGSSLALTLAQGRVSTLDLFSLLVNSTAALQLRPVTDRLPPLPGPSSAGHAACRAELLARLGQDLAQLQQLVAGLDAEALMKVYEYQAQHPEHLVAQRQFLPAREQVAEMHTRYPDAATGRG
jgi:ribosomal protein L16 Arg81 hydroxylase